MSLREVGTRISLLLVVLAAVTVSIGCDNGTGNKLESLAEGKLAPPGVTLFSEEKIDDRGFQEAEVIRIYEANGRPFSEVLDFYRNELVGQRQWRLTEPPTDSSHVWTDDEFRIVVAESSLVEGFVVTVMEERK